MFKSRTIHHGGYTKVVMSAKTLSIFSLTSNIRTSITQVVIFFLFSLFLALGVHVVQCFLFQSERETWYHGLCGSVSGYCEIGGVKISARMGSPGFPYLRIL